MSRVQIKCTGKRRSTEVDGLQPQRRVTPLVPDLSPAQKAMIYEQLSKSLSLSRAVSQPQLYEKVAICEHSSEIDLHRTESRSHKIGRKIKGLFMNDQSKAPCRQQSLDDRNRGRRLYSIPNDDDDFNDDDIYRYR